jgi:hypothetical protein
LPPDDGICKSEPCLECRHAPTAGNIGTPRAGSPEIAPEDIPARWWKPQPPKLDQDGLTKAIRARDKALKEAEALTGPGGTPPGAGRGRDPPSADPRRHRLEWRHHPRSDGLTVKGLRKLLTPATIARLETQFQLPEERTEIQSDLHYKSTETPKLPGA